MKKLLLSLAFVVAALSASAQFKLTVDGMVNADQPDKKYVIIDMPGKTQAQIYETVMAYLSDNYKQYPCTGIQASFGHFVKLTMNCSARSQHNRVINTMNYYTGRNAFLHHYTIVFRMKDGKLRVEVPQLGRFTISVNGNTYSGYMYYPKGKNKQKLFDLYGAPSQRNMEIIRGIEDYFNKMVSNATTYSGENDW